MLICVFAYLFVLMYTSIDPPVCELCDLQDPGAYGQLGLSDLFEMREECLREFGFSDVYRLDKEAENNVALQVTRRLYNTQGGLGFPSVGTHFGDG